MYERTGLVRIVVLPDGCEQIQFSGDPNMSPEDREALDSVFDLLTAVGGELDAPYDPERTRADYESCSADGVPRKKNSE